MFTKTKVGATAKFISDIKRATMEYIAVATKQDFIKRFEYSLHYVRRSNIPQHRKNDILSIDELLQEHKDKSLDVLAQHIYFNLNNIKTGLGFSSTGNSKYRDKLYEVLRKYCPEVFNNDTAFLDESADQDSGQQQENSNATTEEELICKTEQLLEAIKKEKEINKKLQEENAKLKQELDVIKKNKRLDNFAQYRSTAKDIKDIKEVAAAYASESSEGEEDIVEQGELSSYTYTPSPANVSQSIYQKHR